jgi:Co/Zn/Cd efflux system component
LDALRDRQSGTLKVVLAINAAMFVVVLVAGVLANSTALLSDSLDNLGDALTYGLSLLAVHRAPRAKAKVALFKGILILAAGLFVASQVAHKTLFPVVPIAETMGWIGALALVANGFCLGVLWKHRHEDINMSSVWECSRNDIASNLAVIAAAFAVSITGSGWADVAVGGLLACLFLRSAWNVLHGAMGELRESARGLTSSVPDATRMSPPARDG